MKNIHGNLTNLQVQELREYMEELKGELLNCQVKRKRLADSMLNRNETAEPYITQSLVLLAMLRYEDNISFLINRIRNTIKE